jgi:hypothetical protein
MDCEEGTEMKRWFFGLGMIVLVLLTGGRFTYKRMEARGFS